MDAPCGIQEYLCIGEVGVNALSHDLNVLQPYSELLPVSLLNSGEVVVDFVHYVPLEPAKLLNVPFGCLEVEVRYRSVQIKWTVEHNVANMVLRAVTSERITLLAKGQHHFVVGLVRDYIDDQVALDVVLHVDRQWGALGLQIPSWMLAKKVAIKELAIFFVPSRLRSPVVWSAEQVLQETRIEL